MNCPYRFVDSPVCMGAVMRIKKTDRGAVTYLSLDLQDSIYKLCKKADFSSGRMGD